MTVLRHKKDIIAFLYITTITVVAVVYGFYLIPSPLTEQQITADHKRVIDLYSLQATIDDYYQNNSMLPQSLNDLTYNANDTTAPLSKTDPRTKAPYEYIVTSPTDYKLCATFATSSSNDDLNGYDNKNGDYASFSDQFVHPAGHKCFDEFETPTDTTTPSAYPSDYPSDYPTSSPCKPGLMCPLQTPKTSPAVYNQSLVPTSYPVGGGGSGDGFAR